jgi:hypothetical protein
MIKKIGITTTALCLIAQLTIAAELKNASFEKADTHTAKPAHWGVWGEKLERVTGWSPKLDGEAMIAYKHWEIGSSHTASSGIFQDAEQVVAGATYAFTIVGFADKPDWGNLDGRVEIRLEATIDGKQVYLDRETSAFDKFLGEWKKFTVRAKTPVDNIRAVVEFKPASSENKGGAFKIDLTDLSRVD